MPVVAPRVAVSPSDIPLDPLQIRRWPKLAGNLFFVWGLFAASVHSAVMVSLCFLFRVIDFSGTIIWTITLVWAKASCGWWGSRSSLTGKRISRTGRWSSSATIRASSTSWRCSPPSLDGSCSSRRSRSSSTRSSAGTSGPRVHLRRSEQQGVRDQEPRRGGSTDSQRRQRGLVPGRNALARRFHSAVQEGAIHVGVEGRGSHRAGRH